MLVKRSFKKTCLYIIVGLLSFNPVAQAELGDYSFFQVLKNLFVPPKADNPVTQEQRQTPFPMLSNPTGFSDGFSAGKYSHWQTVQLHPSTGAVCGNGSPYKFFVNRVAHTSNTLFYLEAGGACWDHDSCSGKGGVRGARNPNGVSDNYMSLLNPGASLISPFVVRMHPWSRTKVQNWNMVYMPYCTGDTHIGDRVAVYENKEKPEQPLVWHHNGARNLRAVAAWMKDNIQKPAQLLTQGCSAGGTGSLANYHLFRRDMQPVKSFMLNDSGPLYTAMRNGSPLQYPSLPMHTLVRAQWGLDGDGSGLGILPYIAQQLPQFDLNNLGSMYRALSSQYPGDRFGHTQFWEDANYSSYSYERFHPDIINEKDPVRKKQLILERWQQDMQGMHTQLANYNNVGYYSPRFRNVNESHCSTVIDFENGDIQEQGLELKHFIHNVLDGNGSVMQASENDAVADHNKPFNLLYSTIDNL